MFKDYKIYDISQAVFSCKVYPGDPAPQREILSEIEKGDVCNLTAFSMCAHNGTHIDAPYHFMEDGDTVENIPLEICIGDCFVAAHEGDITQKDAEAILLKAGEQKQRLLIKGKAVVTAEAAKVFQNGGVRLVGNESQTVGPEDAPMEVHKILLGAGVVLLEGVCLGEVTEGAYFLHALPLNLEGSDGAPCRATLIKYSKEID